jgi:hypothetical protein
MYIPRNCFCLETRNRGVLKVTVNSLRRALCALKYSRYTGSCFTAPRFQIDSSDLLAHVYIRQRIRLAFPCVSFVLIWREMVYLWQSIASRCSGSSLDSYSGNARFGCLLSLMRVFVVFLQPLQQMPRFD